MVGSATTRFEGGGGGGGFANDVGGNDDDGLSSKKETTAAHRAARSRDLRPRVLGRRVRRRTTIRFPVRAPSPPSPVDKVDRFSSSCSTMGTGVRRASTISHVVPIVTPQLGTTVVVHRPDAGAARFPLLPPPPLLPPRPNRDRRPRRTFDKYLRRRFSRL